MNIFLGIGASHFDDVYEFVYRNLDELSPQAITLEKRINFSDGLDDYCVFNGSDLEFNPALEYALERGVPFYLIDTPIIKQKLKLN